MEKGELFLFMKDFDLLIAPSQQHDLFKKISSNQTPLDFEQFKAALPIIGYEFAKAKAKEIKYRLKEIKFVLEYPNSKVSEALEKLINDIEDKPQDGKKLNILGKKEIK